MKVTFLGLGIMGSRMAEKLLENEVDLTVYNRSPKPVEALVKKGASTADSYAEAVADADVVFSMLSTPQVVSKIFFGEEGVLSSMKNGAIWADCSTVNPSFSIQSKEIADQAGIRFVDAPVSGSLPQAANAQLIFLLGGDKRDVEQISPFLEYMGRKIMHIGEHGKGASYKMLVNAMLAQSMLIFSETVVLGQKMGIEREFLLDTLPELIVTAPFVKFKVDRIRKGEYDEQFPLEWMHKDLHLASQTAYEHDQPAYLLNVTKELFAEAKKSGMSRMDFSAIHKYLEENH